MNNFLLVQMPEISILRLITHHSFYPLRLVILLADKTRLCYSFSSKSLISSKLFKIEATFLS